MITLIVFLPLIAALIAGLGGRWIGNFAAKLVTTGALFLSAAVSWWLFKEILTGDQIGYVQPVATWIVSGELTARSPDTNHGATCSSQPPL